MVAEAIEEAEVVMVATEAEEEVAVVAEEGKEVVPARTTTETAKRVTIEETKTVSTREAHQEREEKTMIVQIEAQEEITETTEVHQEKEEEATTTKDPEEMRVIGMVSLPEVAKEREATDKLTTMVRDPEEEALATEVIVVDKEEEAAQEEEEMAVREVDMTTEVHQENLGSKESPENQWKRESPLKQEMNSQRIELAGVNSMLTIPLKEYHLHCPQNR